MGFFAFVVVLLIVGAIAFVFLKANKPKKFHPGFDLNKQSVVVDVNERIHRHAASLPKNGVENGLLKYSYEEAQTLYQSFQRGKKLAANRPCLGWRRDENSDYQWITYQEVDQRFTDFGSGLINLMGIPEDARPFIGIYSQNRPEWVIVEQAANAYSFPLVPLYDTLGQEAVAFIVNQAEISVVVVDPPKVATLLASHDQCKTLKYIVKIGDVTLEEKEQASKVGLSLFSMQHVEEQGRSRPHKHHPPKPNDLATICYTSGTTGDPKGAMLTHANIIADSAAACYIQDISSAQPISYNDVHISYLPLAHMFERVVQCWVLSSGASIGFFRGDVKGLVSDIQTLRPTIFPSVPRLLNRIYDEVVGAAQNAGGWKYKLFQLAVAAKEAELKQGICRNDSIWDTIVFRKVQKRFGGRVRFMITGAAPISGKVLQFLRCAMGCIFVEGYGQTECTAGSNITAFGDYVPGSVGPPLPCNEIKLVDVPDMNYFAKNDQGEVCFRGHNVMLGYFKSPEKTREAIDEQGWLHSGDIGCWLPNGTLKIIDRKKAIFKLAQGEYIAPEKIENVYLRTPGVMQIFVYGNSLKASLVAVVIPDEDKLKRWMKEHVPSVSTDQPLAQLVKDPTLTEAVLKSLTKVGTEGGLKPFEQVKAIRLSDYLFTVENGLLTPTFKSKRPQLEKQFKPDIDELYSKLKD